MTKPLSDAQLADVARQPVMTLAEAETIALRVRLMLAEEQALPTLPLPLSEAG